MSTIEFEAFAKIARLNRNITITEKIDGTNAAVVITKDGEIGAQSRNRLITPEDDNYGFARWVRDNSEALVLLLGPGRHFGEWWGSGIQRKYGLSGGDKRFSLFNTDRWANLEVELLLHPITGLGVVPVLYDGIFDQHEIDERIDRLRIYGSEAAHGFSRPEGIVVYHHALRSSFKVTLEGDSVPKGAAGHALDIEQAVTNQSSKGI